MLLRAGGGPLQARSAVMPMASATTTTTTTTAMATATTTPLSKKRSSCSGSGSRSSSSSSRRSRGGRALALPSLRALKHATGHADAVVHTPVLNDKGIAVSQDELTPFKKIMSANRGEIAVRTFRAGTELGLTTTAIYSRADRLQPHRYKADESYQVGEANATPVAAYLDVEGIISIAKAHGVDVIHPGYGFLSENATFARRCEEEGIAFVGPRPETIEAMGDKTAARKAAEACGVPTVPGTDGTISSAAEAAEFAERAGYPVILKAAMGGGGRGMRVVRAADEMQAAFDLASGEAASAFGDGRMFCEKLVEDPRHIEVQILADNHGGVVHLYERDCSVQRRHQKVVEIAPAPSLPAATREALHRDAVALARHVGYRNAGTVEFMVARDGSHYFLEVNPRIQVEHTVTEEVTGVDLVQAQVRIAGGATLADLGLATQEAVPRPSGFAIQCRITCEDPERSFQPDAGRIQAYRSPGGPGVRLDGAMTAGNVVSRHYDSLLVKVVCKANTFLHAVQKMQRSLYEFHIRGVKTNILFLENVLRHPEFLSGAATTSFIERHPALFAFSTDQFASSKLLTYLADVVVNGASHPGAVGPPPAKRAPDPPRPPLLPLGSPAAASTSSSSSNTASSSSSSVASSPRYAPPPAGWKDVLSSREPEGWAKAVRAHRGLLVTDTTMRDAHQSLLATRVRTHDLVRAAPFTAHALASAASLEVWGGATFDVSLRFLHECPWKRLEALRAAIPNVPLQMLLRGANAVGYTSYADNVVREFTREAHSAGVDIFRVFDSLNYLDNMLFGVDAVRAVDGAVAEGTLCYTGDVTSPVGRDGKSKNKYDLEYYLDLAEELVNGAGVHALAIKDMAGLLKPNAATMLVSALRERFPDTPIAVHTHDTAGTGVATALAAAAAGADIVDGAVDAMAGTTSQPSLGAIVAATRGTDLDTGVDPRQLARLSAYWEGTRALYSPFESDMRSPSADVYDHEMPGGQYTNLKFQALSLGLLDEGSSSSGGGSGNGNGGGGGLSGWEKVKAAYAAANLALGDIVKVTPSSKVVGDLAQFMVANNIVGSKGKNAASADITLGPEYYNECVRELVDRAAELSFPASVVEFMQGSIGQPAGGFPEPLRSRVLKGADVVEGRPGASIPAADLAGLGAELRAKHGSSSISYRDVLSAALYPKVFDEFKEWELRYSRYTSALPTGAFLAPLAEDEEVEVELAPGNTVSIRYKATSQLQPDGKREVFFEANGIPRAVEVVDTRTASGGSGSGSGDAPLRRAARERADPSVLGSVGAPMAGTVVEVKTTPGVAVKAGEPLAVLSAMKMETAVCAPCGGVVQHVAVDAGDSIDAGDLVVRISEELPDVTDDARASMDEAAAAIAAAASATA